MRVGLVRRILCPSPVSHGCAPACSTLDRGRGRSIYFSDSISLRARLRSLRGSNRGGGSGPRGRGADHRCPSPVPRAPSRLPRSISRLSRAAPRVPCVRPRPPRLAGHRHGTRLVTAPYTRTVAQPCAQLTVFQFQNADTWIAGPSAVSESRRHTLE